MAFRSAQTARPNTGNSTVSIIDTAQDEIVDTVKVDSARRCPAQGLDHFDYRQRTPQFPTAFLHRVTHFKPHRQGEGASTDGDVAKDHADRSPPRPGGSKQTP
jgi:hypothetical protein